MKKMLILLTLVTCMAGSLLASPQIWSGLLMKKGTYSYYPELIQLWQPVPADLSRIIICGDPGVNMKYNTYSKLTEDMPKDWKFKLDDQYQLQIFQGSLLYLDVAPGEHVFTQNKQRQTLATEAGKTYYLELNLHESAEGFFTLITDEAIATKLLTPNRHVFRDPLPFNQQPKGKALFKGNKVLKK
jgi:hypothetical protein